MPRLPGGGVPAGLGIRQALRDGLGAKSGRHVVWGPAAVADIAQVGERNLWGSHHGAPLFQGT